MCKKFEGINFGPSVFGQQLLELFCELSDIFTQILLTKTFTVWYTCLNLIVLFIDRASF